MPIDTSIYSQLQPAKVDSPLNALAQVMQVQHAQSQNKLADLLFSEKQREVDENANFRNALDGLNLSDTASMQAALPKLLQASPKLGMAFQKQLSDQAKTDAAAQKDRVEALGKAFSIHKDALAGVNDPQSAASWVKAGYSDPLLGAIAAKTGTLEETLARIPTDPKGFAEWKQRNMLGAEKLMQYLTPDANATLQAQTSRANNADTNAVAMRGQNMTDSRGREANRLKAQENEINHQGIVGKKIQDVELKLQDDYRAESKGYSETATAMKKVLGAIETADKNPGSALAAGTAFMKLLDPNSVVRESELGMALNASGWFDRAMNIANTLQAGKVMTPKQKENLRKASETLFEEAKAAQREVDAAYERRAKAYGADPSRIIVDRGQRRGVTEPSTGGLTAEEQKELAELRQRLGKQ